jgi:putative transferase (TIGR04331 family)
MYCPDSVQLKLCWESRFGAAPWALPSKEETASSSAPDPRRSALSNLPAADEFMRLWVRSLPENFPALYLEGFKAARERALKRLRNPPRALVSATGWHYSEPFKFLAAELPQLGGRLVAVQHGSGYGLFRSMPMELHERRISDLFLGWNEAPALQLASLRTAARRRAPSRSRRLLFVATTNPRYLFRFYSAPQAHPLDRYFEWQARFLEGVGASLRERIVVRLHPRDFGHCLPQRLQERLGRLRWDRQRSFIESAKKSGLLIIDHPGTSMLAALGGNFPTLLFWDPGLWEFRPEAGPHLESLRQAGLLQESPESAARALEEILREGPDRWWNRGSVQRARRQFVERYVPLPNDWLRRWSERLPR